MAITYTAASDRLGRNSILTTGVTTLVTDSVTPSANTLIIFWVATIVASGPGTGTPTISGCGITWTVQKQQARGTRRLFLITGSGASPSSGIVTVTAPAGDTWDQRQWSMHQLPGADISVAPLVAANTISGTAGLNPSVNYNNVFTTGSAGISCWLNGGGSGTGTPASGWTEVDDLAIASSQFLENQVIVGAATTAGVTNGAAFTVTYIIAEVKVAPAIGPATKLAITTQPAVWDGNAVFPTPISVAIQDALGNQTADSSLITATLNPEVGNVGVLLGTNPKAATSGAVTLDDLQVKAPRGWYTITCSSPGLTSATTSRFHITPMSNGSVITSS